MSPSTTAQILYVPLLSTLISCEDIIIQAEI